ncbi:MAG: hypothetical protein GY906_35600 [bacterium]|nr:hypothetical protein [bacterium]
MTDDELRGMIVAFVIMAFLAGCIGMIIAGNIKPDQPDCTEDEVWAATPYHNEDGYEDRYGVYRACIHIEELP